MINIEKSQKVYALLPDTGLGNRMLVWAKAYAFAKKYHLELLTSSWWGLHWGAWFRNEKYKRVYFGYFKKAPFITHVKFILFRLNALHIPEPDHILMTTKNVVYVFHEIVTSSDYFETIKPFRDDIRLAIHHSLHSRLLRELDTCKHPAIGIHIRRGDFKLGSTLTPESFFISSILAIRKVVGMDLPVEIFTDAFPEEIPFLLSLPNVHLTKPKPDILDLLLLSRCKISILSIGSTFSFWGGFLSNGILLRHPDEWHPPIRPNAFNEFHYESNFDPSKSIDSCLLDQLRNIEFETIA